MTLLLIPAVLSFGVDRLTARRSGDAVSAKASALHIKENRGRDAAFYFLCGLIALSLLTLVAVLFLGAFTACYPYDLSFTWWNFAFNQSTGGFRSYLNSIWMSVLTAVLGTAFVFVYAYLIERGKCAGVLKQAGRLLSSLPLALPGMVIGLSFIFFFNHRDNPLHFLYGTVMILVLANLVHFYSVPFVTASIAITHMEEAGDFAQAAAMSLLILLVNVLARGLYEILVHRIKLRGRRQADRS